jgi:hypothetical protein
MHLTSSRSEDRVTGPRRLHYQMLGYALPEDSIPTATFAPSSRCWAFIGFDLHASTPVSDLTAVILRCLSFQRKHYQLKNPGCHNERLRVWFPDRRVVGQDRACLSTITRLRSDMVIRQDIKPPRAFDPTGPTA